MQLQWLRGLLDQSIRKGIELWIRLIYWAVGKQLHFRVLNARYHSWRIGFWVLKSWLTSQIHGLTRREIPSSDDLVIVSGADSTHYLSLTNLLRSLYVCMPESKVVVFDLGMTDTENVELAKRFKKVEFRKFDYSKYPAYFNIRVNAGQYAWKPAIIADTMNEFKRPVIWMDAGTLIHARLDRTRNVIKEHGLFIRKSVLNCLISRCIHPETLRYLGLPDKWLDSLDFEAGFIGVDYANIKVREIINRWKECALVRECIAPEGSNKSNHRQDQAVLTVLIYLFLSDEMSSFLSDETSDHIRWVMRKEFSTHNDIDCLRQT